LELGQYLVRELGFEDGDDTLGRWMSHHVAQLMDAVEHAATDDERIRAQQAATETILKIWEHRAILPGKAYPLHTLKEVLPILKHLQPTNNPFDYVQSYHTPKRERLAAELFDNLTRLIIALLWMRLPPSKEEDKPEEQIIRTLDETEQYILRTIHSWSDLIIPEENTEDDSHADQSRDAGDSSHVDQSSNTGDDSHADQSSDESKKFDPDQLALAMIHNIGATLDALKANLEGKPDEEDSPSPWLKILEEAYNDEAQPDDEAATEEEQRDDVE
jgi:hypothetical protein